MSCSSILNGWATASSSFRAIRPSVAGSSKSSTTTMNSSPPSRASRSDVAQRGGERRADALQELVADPVAERVVDVLEPVEVDEQHADAAAAALRLRDRLREPLVQQQPVGQSRSARRASPCAAGAPRPGSAADTSCTNDRIETMLPRSSSRHEWYHSHQIVCPSLRLLRVRPVVRGSSPLMRRVRSSATAPRSASCSNGLPSIGIPSTSSARQPKSCSACGDQRTSRKSRSHSSTASGVLLMCEESIQLARRQRVLVALLVVHVRVHGVDADDPAFRVAVRRVMDGFPALLADRLREQLLDRDRLALQHALQQRAHLGEALAADDVGHGAAGELVALQAEPFLVVAVEEPIAVLAIDVRDARRHVVHDEAQLRFGRAQRFLRLLQSVDVVHQDERARHVAGRRRIGHDADRHPPRLAVGARDEAIEFGRLAVERAGDLPLRAFEDRRDRSRRAGAAS